MMDMFKVGSLGPGIAIGVGAAFLLPVTARIVGAVAKPLIKETIKGGMYVYDTGRHYAAEVGETLEDISAEARAEMKKEPKPAKPAKAKSSES